MLSMYFDTSELCDTDLCYECTRQQFLNDELCYPDQCACNPCLPRSTCRNTRGSHECICDNDALQYDSVRGCVEPPPPPPTVHIQCSASGDPHFRTFDGHMIHFMGVCVYTLTEACGQTGELTPFSIDIKVATAFMITLQQACKIFSAPEPAQERSNARCIRRVR